jgi:hypothetical protein
MRSLGRERHAVLPIRCALSIEAFSASRVNAPMPPGDSAACSKEFANVAATNKRARSHDSRRSSLQSRRLASPAWSSAHPMRVCRSHGLRRGLGPPFMRIIRSDVTPSGVRRAEVLRTPLRPPSDFRYASKTDGVVCGSTVSVPAQTPKFPPAFPVRLSHSRFGIGSF